MLSIEMFYFISKIYLTILDHLPKIQQTVQIADLEFDYNVEAFLVLEHQLEIPAMIVTSVINVDLLVYWN